MADTEIAGAVKAALAQVEIPGGGTLAEYSGLSEIIVTKSAIALAISVQPGMEAAFGPARVAAQQAAESVGQGRKVMISLTSDKAPAQAAPTGQAAAHGRPGPAPKSAVPGVKNIIVVGSGKGGVGKSTVATNLALAFAAEGLKTGILDADLYGPSIPKLLGIEGKPAVREDGIFSPHQAYGLSAISIGSMLTPGQAVVWRGPMASSAIRQFVTDVNWGELDYLVIDMPPGTGDIHLTLVQTVPVTGVVVVTTPQDVALADAKKGIAMFGQEQMKVPIIGLIENMSYFTPAELPDSRYYIFGKEGGKRLAEEYDIPFLGQIPLVQSIREGGDQGVPVMMSDDEISKKAFEEFAAAAARSISMRNADMTANEVAEVVEEVGMASKVGE